MVGEMDNEDREVSFIQESEKGWEEEEMQSAERLDIIEGIFHTLWILGIIGLLVWMLLANPQF
ncbi:hypothetical protein [Neptunomonas sp.]|uniref:hypothetical protein n=1 Tax=Neptunomonas sp. TaxID=1971898 RepID=UPI0035649208